MTSTSDRGVTLTHRIPDFDFSGLNKDWFQNNLAISSLLAVFSITATEAEAFFIRNIAELLPDIKDPQLKKEVQLFIKQEAAHSQVHGKLNRHLGDLGYPVDEASQKLKSALERIDRLLPMKYRIAVMVALEHFISDMGFGLLEDPKLTDKTPEVARQLIRWHSFEEVEHRAVAFDAFQTVFGKDARSYDARALGLFLGLTLLVPQVTSLSYRFMESAQKGLARDPKAWNEIRRFMARFDGIPRNVIKFLTPGFHPWVDIDISYLFRKHHKTAVQESWARRDERKGSKTLVSEVAPS